MATFNNGPNGNKAARKTTKILGISSTMAMLMFASPSSISAFSSNAIFNTAAFFKPPVQNKMMMASDNNSEIKPKPPSTPPPPYFISDVEGPNNVVSEVVANVAEDIMGPLLASPIEQGVAASTIKGAVLSATTLALVSGASITAATSAGLAAAYVVIHPGVSGKTFRIIGDISWSASQLAIKTYEEAKMNETIGNLSKLFIASALDALKIGDGNFRSNLLEAKMKVNDVSVEEVVMEAEQVNRMVDVIMQEKEKELDEIERIEAERVATVKAEKAEVEDQKIATDTMNEEDWEASVKLAQKLFDNEVIEKTVETASVAETEEINNDILDQMTLVQLKDTLRSKSLKLSGNKAELIARLRESNETSEMADNATEEAEAQKIASEQAEAQKIATEKAKAQKLADEEAEAQKIATEKAEAQKIANEEAEAQRIAAEEAEAQKIAAEEAEALKIATEEAEAQKLAAEEAEAQRIANEEAEAQRIATEEAEAQRIANEEAEAQRIATEEAEAQRIATEEAEAQRIATEEAEAQRIAIEEAEAQRIATEQTEALKIAAEQAEAERIAAEAQKIVDDEAEVERMAEAERIAAEDIGAAARRAVELFNQGQDSKNLSEKKDREEPAMSSEVLSTETLSEWGKMTVAQLKDHLRSRGLKLSGKKADLIVRLQENSEQQ